MKRLQNRGESRGIEICFENAGSYGNENPFILADIVREIDGSMCFDTGHMFAEHGQDSMELFLEQNLDIISHFHVHDTREGHDMHMPVGSGGINWEYLAEFLQDFQGTVCMELITDDQEYHSISARKLLEYLD
jgi:sugar phosphate isomerase/epimerase